MEAGRGQHVAWRPLRSCLPAESLQRWTSVALESLQTLQALGPRPALGRRGSDKKSSCSFKANLLAACRVHCSRLC